jgi:chromosomal replication initiation ATPase DnaA
MFLEERLALLEHRVARLEDAGGMPRTDPPPALSLEGILKNVCKHYAVTIAAVLGSRKEAAVVKVRFIAIWIARRTTPLTAQQLGRHFHRDHSTILYSIRAVENLRDTDPAYRAETDLWLKRFEAPAHSEIRVHPCPSVVKNR